MKIITEDERVLPLAQRKRRPSAPGALAGMLIEEQGLSQTEAARRLGITRVHFNRFLNDKVALSPDMAGRLGRFFGNGAAFWLRLQQKRDMWDLLHSKTRYREVEPLGMHEIAAM